MGTNAEDERRRPETETDVNLRAVRKANDAVRKSLDSRIVEEFAKDMEIDSGEIVDAFIDAARRYGVVSREQGGRTICSIKSGNDEIVIAYTDQGISYMEYKHAGKTKRYTPEGVRELDLQ